jgi:predicted porin
MFNLGDFSMKKTLVAIAALAASAAFAQSTVTLSGGLGMGYQAKPNAAKDKGFGITDYTIRFSGSEDLGGGLKANFTMELSDAASGAVVGAAAPFTAVNNNGQFRSLVGRDTTRMELAGGFGTINLRNTRSTDLITMAYVAPVSLDQQNYDSGIIARAPVDGFGYSSPVFAGGFRVGIDFAESATDGNVTPVNKTITLGGSYANGPLFVAAAHKSTSGLAAGIRKTNLELVGTYDFGVAKVGLGYDGKRAGLPTAAAEKAAFGWGVSVPLGAATIGVNWAKRDVNKQTEGVVSYALSKRTSVVASFGKQTNDVNSQYRIKVQHNF